MTSRLLPVAPVTSHSFRLSFRSFLVIHALQYVDGNINFPQPDSNIFKLTAALTIYDAIFRTHKSRNIVTAILQQYEFL